MNATCKTPLTAKIMPLLHFLDKVGMMIWAILAVVSMYVAFLVEKRKKEFDIQTYKEIILLLRVKI